MYVGKKHFLNIILNFKLAALPTASGPKHLISSPKVNSYIYDEIVIRMWAQN